MILSGAEKSPAKLKIFSLCPAAKKTVMSNSDKPFRRNMHQKPSYEFNSGKGHVFPLSLVSVVLDRKYNIAIFDALDSVIADCNSVRILSKILDNGLRTVKSLFAIRLPFLCVEMVQKFLECIVPTIP